MDVVRDIFRAAAHHPIIALVIIVAALLYYVGKHADDEDAIAERLLRGTPTEVSHPARKWFPSKRQWARKGGFATLPDGTWGVLAERGTAPGDHVDVRRKNGSVTTVRVARIVGELDGFSVCELDETWKSGNHRFWPRR